MGVDTDNVSPPAARGALRRLGFPLFLAAVTLVLLPVDHVPRFYQGDSTSYFSTGLNNFVPLDRSWAYGYAGRWLVTATRASWSLIAFQAAALAFGLFCLQRAVRRTSAGMALPVLIPCLLVLDPLDQALARFWLTDTPACAAFLCFLAAVPGAALRGRPAAFVLAFVAVLITIFLRVAYLPATILTLLCCLAATCRPGAATPPGCRRRLLLLTLLPLVATVLLGFANSRVVPPPEHGRFFVNRMSRLYTMGVFLPALRYEDFQRAGVPISPAEFAALRTSDYDGRAFSVWRDGPTHFRWLMQQRLHLEPRDEGFERACGAVVRSALLHHPQDIAATYVWSTLLYIRPQRWVRVMPWEFGLLRPLPEWVPAYLGMITHSHVRADLAAVPSPLPAVVERVAWIYPILLVLGVAAALRLLIRRAAFGGADLLAAAMLAAFASAPLYSHALKPRYMLAAVLLAGWTTGTVLVNDGAAIHGAVRRRPRA